MIQVDATACLRINPCSEQLLDYLTRYDYELMRSQQSMEEMAHTFMLAVPRSPVGNHGEHRLRRG